MLTAILQNGSYNAFPGLVRTATNRRVLVYRKGIVHVGDLGTIVCRKASGRGATYSSESTVLSDSPRDCRDPEIAEITLSGGAKRLIVSCFVYNSGLLPNGIRVVFSDDDGDTWQAAVTCTSSFSAWVACSGKVVQLSSGDLLLPCYGSDATDQLIEVLRSTDYGATWTPSRPFGAIVDGGLQEPNIALLRDGSLLMLVRTAGVNTYESISTDSGVTWSALAVATTDYGRPHCIQLPDGRVGLIQRDGNNTRATLTYRSAAGVWGVRVFLDVGLQERMTYASSVIDENSNWEIVVCQEPAASSGTVSDIYGITLPIVSRYMTLSAGGSTHLLGLSQAG